MMAGVLLALALNAVQQGTAEIEKPVASYNTPYLCNYAKVYHLKNRSYLSVRSGPGEQFSKIDRLGADTSVYVCDEKRGVVKNLLRWQR